MQNNRCTYIEGESYGSRKGPKEPPVFGHAPRDRTLCFAQIQS